ncbi:MAG TPA: hypothetical protein VMO17_12450 [Terriglobia bacterium]|nr:hypothetical protein [Terriglobia bacterium]
MSPFIIPLGVFAMVVLIVGIADLAKIRNLEIDVHQKLHGEEMEHQRKMRELELELERIKQGN